MAIAELSITSASQRRARRAPNSQSGQVFNARMARPKVRVFSFDRDDPKSDYLAHDIVLFTAIESLPDRSIRVVCPLRTLVQPQSGVYMASLVDTAISASGESLMEAVDSLKDIVAAKFRLFSRKEHMLGGRLRHQLSVLRQSLRVT